MTGCRGKGCSRAKRRRENGTVEEVPEEVVIQETQPEVEHVRVEEDMPMEEPVELEYDESYDEYDYMEDDHT